MQIDVHLLCGLTGKVGQGPIREGRDCEFADGAHTSRARCSIRPMGPFDPTQALHLDGKCTWRARCSSRPINPITCLKDSSFGVLVGMPGSRSRFGYSRSQDWQGAIPAEAICF